MRRLSNLLRTLFSTSGPTVGVEIASRHVTAVQLAWTGQHPVLIGRARTELPDGAIVPHVNETNIVDQGAVVAALRQVFSQLPRRPSRIAVILPDSVAKVSLVRFEKVPAHAEDLDQLIRWRVKKSAPFRLENTQISYTRGAKTPEGSQEFVVVLMRRDIVEAYEQACAAVGAHAGLIDLASFNLINVAVAGGASEDNDDWLLVHAAVGYNTLAIVRGKDLIFFRTRPTEGAVSLVDLVHQTAMYCQDRLESNGFSRTLLAGDSDQPSLRLTLQERLGSPVEPISTSMMAPVSDRTGANLTVLDELASPIGILLRNGVWQA